VVDIFMMMGYTIVNLKCAITLVILNLHHFKRDSYIVWSMPCPPFRPGEGSEKDCGCPPSIG